ncbi:hypothetical protein F4678DRAFT_472613 [Xylaria arbuscula]|nr:hypothetical protein F4678DRAFT_472613 [Xylaria arbuscula]
MAAVAYARHFITSLSPAQVCQLFYVLSAATVLTVAAVPDSAKRLLTRYGARGSGDLTASAAPETHRHTDQGFDNSNAGPLFRFISRLTSVGMIPHSWFIHFYILSLFCTVFWAIQFFAHGSIMGLIVDNQLSKSASSSMALGQVLLVWFFMGLQGARRLYEYLTVLRPSSSRMWVVHWLLGNLFYLCTSVSIWVEGSGSIQCSAQNCLDIKIPVFKSTIASLMFLSAWVMQYRCHQHLAGLKKYSLPEEGLFRYLVCPHYTCECLLYLSLAVLAAPEGQFCNQTLACAVLFVSTNLGVTASGTKSWYGEKFGEEKVQGRWKMIPIVF